MAAPLKDLVYDLHSRILQGDMLGAFEDHYAEDVVMQEPREEPRVGKDVNRKAEQEWMDNLVEFRGAEVRNVAINEEEGTVFSEWFNDYTHKQHGEMKGTQVSIQQWRDGKVVEERFYY